MPVKSYVLDDLVLGKSFVLSSGIPLKVGRGPECDIKTLNPSSLDPAYTETQRAVAFRVSRVHFYVLQDKSGDVSLWDNDSRLGLFIKYPNETAAIRVYDKTKIPVGTSVYASPFYEFVLRKRIDVDAQKSAEEKARSETTQIFKSHPTTHSSRKRH